MYEHMIHKWGLKTSAVCEYEVHSQTNIPYYLTQCFYNNMCIQRHHARDPNSELQTSKIDEESKNFALNYIP